MVEILVLVSVSVLTFICGFLLGSYDRTLKHLVRTVTQQKPAPHDPHSEGPVHIVKQKRSGIFTIKEKRKPRPYSDEEAWLTEHEEKGG